MTESSAGTGVIPSPSVAMVRKFMGVVRERPPRKSFGAVLTVLSAPSENSQAAH